MIRHSVQARRDGVFIALTILGAQPPINACSSSVLGGKQSDLSATETSRFRHRQQTLHCREPPSDSHELGGPRDNSWVLSAAITKSADRQMSVGLSAGIRRFRCCSCWLGGTMCEIAAQMKTVQIQDPAPRAQNLEVI